MPRENNEPLENQESKPHLPPQEHPKPKCDCGCQDGKPCLCGHCKHKGAKLVAALIIFFAGFGLAMACRCMKHSPDCPHHYAMMKKHAMMAPNYTDGAGNVIIINTDGSKPHMPKHHGYKNKAMQPQPPAMMPKAAMPDMSLSEVEEED